MSRCDYDTIFQRVFCVTLVAIALTFTVILTNVFVDIDGLLSSKDKLKTYDVPVPVLESEIHEVKVSNMIRPDTFYKGEKNYDDDNDENYRNKRSLDNPKFLFQVKNPKIKSILTNRLATLLEELDAEENIPDNKSLKEGNVSLNDKSKTKEEVSKDELLTAIKGGNRNELADKREEEDMLHLAMHNILLQGIIGHLDLNEVYKKVHSLVKHFKDIDDGKTFKENRAPDPEKESDKEVFNDQKAKLYSKSLKEIKRISKLSHSPSVEENKFFEEMVKCDKLQNDITEKTQIRTATGPTDKRLIAQKGPKVLIKTIIDITSTNKDKARKEINSNSKETIKGIIKLIYNGKSVKFSRMDEEDNQQKEKEVKPIQPIEVTPKDIDEKLNEETKDIDVTEQLNPIKNKPNRKSNSNAYFNKIIDDYFSKYPKRMDDMEDDRYNDNIVTKRLKRHIKIKYEDDETSTLSTKPKKNHQTDDDELFVEIETHFDSKGMKGEKKKKLVRSIIEKIQKAIHSDNDMFNDGKKKKRKHMQVKKRTQNPFNKDKKLLLNKIMLPFDTVEQRHSDPINKVVSLKNSSPLVADRYGENWKKINSGPGFLTVSKSVNSAEMGEVDIDYNRIIPATGIPQRLQKPLNTDNSDEMLNANTFFDLGNLKFLVNNIDGAGLSIGFNQYTDEAPDPETIKLFTGIENLVKIYHQNEATGGEPTVYQDRTKTSMSEEREHHISKRNVISNTNEHVMIRRSIKQTHEKDFHSNEYKIIFNKDYLPYNSYQEIYENKKKKIALNKETENIIPDDSDNMETIRKNNEIKELPTLMSENNNVFYKKLKPSEILSLASLLSRKKRSLNMHKITNLKRRMKVNRYLNTRAMGRRKITLNKKRSKRQIDKIRIIATDAVSQPRQSEDNIFLVNDENVFADRAILREVETPDAVDVEEKIGEQYDMVPIMYDDPPYATHVFDGRSRHNQLMAKYPHIFLEEVAKSKEEYEPTIFSKIEMKSDNHFTPNYDNIAETTEKTSTTHMFSMPKLDEIVNSIDPRQNYKLTVKIHPKNMSAVNAGFKEIHASINKSFNKDGLMYSSLVNVSEISKVENLHKPKETTTTPRTLTTPFTFMKRLHEQQNRMDMLLRQHKKRLDEQLDHLKRERLNLDKISGKPVEEKVSEKREDIKVSENIEITSLKPDSMLKMTNDDVSKLLASALFQLQSKNDFTSTSTSSTTTTTTAKPTAVTKPQVNINEKINHEILNQITRNTEILQAFLQKLTEKLSKEREPLRRNSEEMRPSKFDYIPRHWKQFQEGSDANYPTIEAKNDTQAPMPLVYAYPSQYPLNNVKHPIPIASVVYHGHIHAEALGKHPKYSKTKENWTEPKTSNDKNLTKYFIDEMEDFKVLPVKDKLKVSTVHVERNNTTAAV